MFSGFNLKLSKRFFKSDFQHYIGIAKSNYEKSPQLLTSTIKDYIINCFEEGNPLDSNLILQSWFP